MHHYFFWLIMALSFVVSADQLITAEKLNSAVPPALLCEVLLWRTEQDLSWDDVISRLRLRTVPAGYPCHAWKAGDQIS